jgi:hypothetical protein
MKLKTILCEVNIILVKLNIRLMLGGYMPRKISKRLDVTTN